VPKSPRWMFVLVAALLLAAGVLPLLLYWAGPGSVPLLMPAQAIARLNASAETYALVDVRPAADFAYRHIDGAQNWPLAQLRSWNTGDPLPTELRGRALLLVCDSGWLSVQAARHLRAAGLPGVFTVRGGMQEWAKAAWRAAGNRSASLFPAAAVPAPLSHFVAFVGPGDLRAIPAVAMPRSEQAAQAAAGLLIKPIYTLATLALILLLIGQTEPYLVALRRGLIAFLIGEMFCYFNFFIFGDDSYLSEYLHSFGMVVCFGFIFYALSEVIETRLLHINDITKRCGATSLCLVCSRYSKITCRARRIAQLGIPVLGLLCFIPLVAPLRTDGYTGVVFGVQYYYARFGVYQLYENQVLPLMALAAFAAAYFPLWRKSSGPLPRLTQVLVAAGAGALCFALIRLSLGTIYASRLVWLDFWEETTELVFISAIIAALWIFRVALFPRGYPSLVQKAYEWIKD
jgi:rhodanese-related sulfurtransferase